MSAASTCKDRLGWSILNVTSFAHAHRMSRQKKHGALTNDIASLTSQHKAAGHAIEYETPKRAQ